MSFDLVQHLLAGGVDSCEHELDRQWDSVSEGSQHGRGERGGKLNRSLHGHFRLEALGARQDKSADLCAAVELPPCLHDIATFDLLTRWTAPVEFEIRASHIGRSNENGSVLVNVGEIVEVSDTPSGFGSVIRLVSLDDCDEVRGDSWEPFTGFSGEVGLLGCHGEADLPLAGFGKVQFAGVYESPGDVIEDSAVVVDGVAEQQTEIVGDMRHVVGDDGRNLPDDALPRRIRLGLERQADSIGFLIQADGELGLDFFKLGLCSPEFGTRVFKDAHV